jgi:hypothetical protein
MPITNPKEEPASEHQSEKVIPKPELVKTEPMSTPASAPEHQNEKVLPKPELVKTEPVSVPKPSAVTLDKFKTKRANTIAGVQTLPTALQIYKISDANDFVRLHPDEENYWSAEICCVNVPIKGQKRDTLHMIEEELAMTYLPDKRILRFRLALACKPGGVFFLCQIPTRNTDNPWNESNLQACEMAKAKWVQVTSRKGEGAEGYDIGFARDQDAFPEPQWLSGFIDEHVLRAFPGRLITDDNNPALLRLIGAKQL